MRDHGDAKTTEEKLSGETRHYSPGKPPPKHWEQINHDPSVNNSIADGKLTTPHWGGEIERKSGTIITGQEFVGGFKPSPYLIDGVMQQGRLCSLTGRIGHAKTAVALHFAFSVATARWINSSEVERGRVIYFAGENPEDLKARVILSEDNFRVRVGDLPMHFIEHPFDIAESSEFIQEQVQTIGETNLIVVDTAAAFFKGASENDNVEMGSYARSMRYLTGLPGNPTVLILTHPTKNAFKNSLEPRGGSAFLGEIDTNFSVWNDDGIITFHHTKIRGPSFEPIIFEIKTYESDRLLDHKGRRMKSAVAELVTGETAEKLQAEAVRDEDDLLVAMLNNPKLSMAGLAMELGWLTEKGEPQKSVIQRRLGKLKKSELVTKNRRQEWRLTTKGQKEAKALKNVG